MRKLFAAMTLVLISAATALSQTTDPMAAVRQYIDSFNKEGESLHKQARPGRSHCANMTTVGV
jgi:hypothetical protein